MVTDAVAVVPRAALLSVTLRVKVGVPVITPAAGSRLRPAGNAPDVTAHVYGGRPPDAETAAVYCWPTVGSGSWLVLIASAGMAAIVMDSPADAVCGDRLESVAVR